MGKRTLVYIISLMSIALVGLIILQFYWINTTLSANLERFKQNVNSALSSAIEKLEQNETLYLIRQQMESNVNVADDFFLVEYDSNGIARWRERQTVKFTQVFGSKSLSEEGYAFEVEEEAVISKSGVAKKTSLDNLDVSNRNRELKPLDPKLVPDSSIISKSHREDFGLKLAKKSQQISEAIKEQIIREMMLSEQKNIKERISQPLLDSILRNELDGRGIKTPFEYGVLELTDSSQNLYYCTAPYIRQNELLQSEFKVRLFPDDIFDRKNTLLVHFPKQDSYLMKKIWAVMGSSILFVLLILIAFFFAVQTIIRQKKLSEITKDFISNMTHELKTPIATVSLATEALLDPDVREMPNLSSRYLGVIKAENERLSQQVERVLQIARLDKGDFKLKITQLDLHAIIEKAIKNINIQIESRGGEITTYLEAKNPQLMGDEVHLSNIIHNLLDNANKYSPEKPVITIRTADIENGIHLMVADKGRGIAKEAINKIFDKFYRVPTGNVHDVKGFGLGLSYVKTMVNAHHGYIKVKSELNQGTTFIIYLPHSHEKS